MFSHSLLDSYQVSIFTLKNRKTCALGTCALGICGLKAKR